MLRNAPNKSVDKDPFGFTGGLDAGNGKWKLGARFYDSSKSAFIQQDRYLGDAGDPLSLNRYIYCGLDPVNFVDPDGFFAIVIPIAYVAAPTVAVIVKVTIAAAVGAGAALIYRATRGKNTLKPDPAAGGTAHSRVKRDPVTGKVTNYETYKPNPKNPETGLDVEKRYDGKGDSHYNKKTGENIDAPHVHDPKSPGGIRKPDSNEIPK